MNATQDLHAAGQSLWLGNITRTMLDDGTLQRYRLDVGEVAELWRRGSGRG